VVVAEELPRWNKGDAGKVLEGLKRRRAAEVALFLGAAPTAVAPPTSRPHLRLTRAGRKDGRGLELLKLQYVKAGAVVGELLAVSGAPRAQVFRKGVDSKAGSMEPLPEGRWGISDIAWAGGKDNYTASWGAGLGPASIPLRYLEPGTTQRSAIEIHYDANAGSSPGTAGCVGMRSVGDLQTLIGWLRDTDPRDLFVDWGLGSCPTPKAT
jgi:lysozyme